MKRFREYADLTAPPEGCADCEECELLDRLFDAETYRSNNARSYSNARDSYQRSIILDHIIRGHHQHLAVNSGRWELELESRGTDSFDSVPADWDI